MDFFNKILMIVKGRKKPFKEGRGAPGRRVGQPVLEKQLNFYKERISEYSTA